MPVPTHSLAELSLTGGSRGSRTQQSLGGRSGVSLLACLPPGWNVHMGCSRLPLSWLADLGGPCPASPGRVSVCLGGGCWLLGQAPRLGGPWQPSYSRAHSSARQLGWCCPWGVGGYHHSPENPPVSHWGSAFGWMKARARLRPAGISGDWGGPCCPSRPRRLQGGQEEGLGRAAPSEEAALCIRCGGGAHRQGQHLPLASTVPPRPEAAGRVSWAGAPQDRGRGRPGLRERLVWGPGHRAIQGRGRPTRDLG